MKIFHTSDWHIGKLLHKQNLIEEQRDVIIKFLKEVDKKKPEVIIIAGDIYDTTIPRVEAIELLNFAIEEIISKNIKLIIISGNHDSSDRLSFGKEMFKKNGLYIVTDCEYIENPIILEDENGSINFYPYPFLTVARGRNILKDDKIDSFNSLAKKLIEESKRKMNTEERNIAIYHGFVIKDNNKLETIESDSERPLSIGGTDFIDSKLFSIFDYVALGHLHGPQKVDKENMRYSGSLMKYSFSEEKQKKGYYEIDIQAKGEIEIVFNEIKPKREVKIIEGDFEKLLKNEYSDDYIMVRLHVKDEIYEPKERLSKIYPNILHMEIIKEKNLNRKINIDIREKLKKKDIFGLFEDFYEEVTERELTEEKKDILKKVFKDIESEFGSEKI